MAFKLIFDEATMENLIPKLSGHPIYAAPGGGLFTPGIVDILGEEGTSDRWQPGNDLTRQLVLGAEACRDVLFYINQFLDPKTRRRAINRMAVPVCSMIDVVLQLLTVTNHEEARKIRDNSWPPHDRDTYQKVARRLRKNKAHRSIRKVRNKIAAHLDSDIFTDRTTRLTPDDILAPLGDCLILLMLSINYPSEWFCWIRPVGLLEDKQHLVVETMYSYPLCIRWISDLEGHVKDVDSMMIAADPRHELQEPIMETVGTYNSLIKAVNSQLAPIYMIPTKDLLPGERRGPATSYSDGKGVEPSQEELILAKTSPT
ncbi:hypothetical protein [Geobacter sulfurreducens]|uniref:hypothetical protein n=1 Tax=Geobacter sulfurreducens TaxID=35554 RepID=UPI000DBB2AFA|nr:hypothetical protein [Geobacter sulfurreducens]BBA69302.1 hypothetical protein YM18_0754 [Geobacter sulfurreducens]